MKRPSKPKYKKITEEATPTRLNKYVAHAGVSSRRKAAELVKAGKIYVNGEVELNPSYEVKSEDTVTFKGKKLFSEKKFVYLLLNKPKGVITSVDDEKGRKTVYDIVKNKVKERIYPVGRLDKETTGLLLLTNDGNLTQKLSHPKFETSKVYQITLDQPLKEEDLNAIKKGVELEDGPIKVDSIFIVHEEDASLIGVELHSGKNRILRRLFESLGYEILKLDRTYYAGLTKKRLPRGRFRKLTRQEVIMLKHFT